MITKYYSFSGFKSTAVMFMIEFKAKNKIVAIPADYYNAGIAYTG